MSDGAGALPSRRTPRAIVPGERMGPVTHVCWMLHNLCNYRCAYCDESYWGGSHRWLKFEHVRKFVDQLLAERVGRTIHVSFTGGEPTLWPDFLKLCAYLKERGCEIGMTTNGSRPVVFWEEAKERFNWMCLSYHPQFTDDEHMIEVIRLVAGRVKTAVRLMMHRDRRYWEKSIAFGAKLKTLRGINALYVEYVPLQNDFGRASTPVVYEAWQQEQFAALSPFIVDDPTSPASPQKAAAPNLWDYQVVYEDGTRELCRPNELVVQDLVNFKGWTCFAGVDMVFVDHNGDIFRGGCHIGGRIGRIRDGEFSLPGAPVVCTKDFCPCGTDIQTRKYAPGAAEGR